jgi:hypothetical protein
VFFELLREVSGREGPPFLLKLVTFVDACSFLLPSFPMKLLTLMLLLPFVWLKLLLLFIKAFPLGLVLKLALLFLELSNLTYPLINCPTRESSTAWFYGFFISMLKFLARSILFMFISLLIYFLKTLRVYLNLKLSRNYWMRSRQMLVSGYFLSLLRRGCSYWNPNCFLFWLLSLSMRLSTSVFNLD